MNFRDILRRIIIALSSAQFSEEGIQLRLYFRSVQFLSISLSFVPHSVQKSRLIKLTFQRSIALNSTVGPYKEILNN